MTPESVIKTLEQWTGLLRSIADVELSCDMSAEEISGRLEKRQQFIHRIQQLDASPAELARLKNTEWHDIDLSSMDKLIAEGQQISASIQRSDSQLIDIAMKKRLEILGDLKRSTLSKGYLPSSSQPKLRLPVIVDDNA